MQLSYTIASFCHTIHHHLVKHKASIDSDLDTLPQPYKMTIMQQLSALCLKAQETSGLVFSLLESRNGHITEVFQGFSKLDEATNILLE